MLIPAIGIFFLKAIFDAFSIVPSPPAAIIRERGVFLLKVLKPELK